MLLVCSIHSKNDGALTMVIMEMEMLISGDVDDFTCISIFNF